MNIFDRVHTLTRTLLHPHLASPDTIPEHAPSSVADDECAVATHLNLGQALARQGDYAGALAAYDAALALDPRLSEVYLCRGMAHLECSAVNDAIADFNSALYHNPELSSALVQRGRASLALDNHRAAVIDCSAALRANPRNLAAYRFRAEAHAVAGNLRGAAADYTAYLRLSGNLTICDRAEIETRLACLRQQIAVN